MNSVEKHLGAEIKAATLLAMRSAKKEIFLVVEGDSDIDLYSNCLGIKRSNLISCGGKKVLMELYALSPRKGVDEGAMFFRDRDNDDEKTKEVNSVILLVTDKYDVEMEVLCTRLFQRIFIDFSASKANEDAAKKAFDGVCSAAATIGALRKYSDQNLQNLNFDDLKYAKFLCYKSMDVNIKSMITYVYSKSKIFLGDMEKVLTYIESITNNTSHSYIACGKDFIDIMNISISRCYQYAAHSECSPSVLSRLVRVSSNMEDIRQMPYFYALKIKVLNNQFSWTGSPI